MTIAETLQAIIIVIFMAHRNTIYFRLHNYRLRFNLIKDTRHRAPNKCHTFVQAIKTKIEKSFLFFNQV